MLVLQGVTRRFGQLAAVADVSLAVESGGFIGIMEQRKEVVQCGRGGSIAKVA